MCYDVTICNLLIIIKIINMKTKPKAKKVVKPATMKNGGKVKKC